VLLSEHLTTAPKARPCNQQRAGASLTWASPIISLHELDGVAWLSPLAATPGDSLHALGSLAGSGSLWCVLKQEL